MNFSARFYFLLYPIGCILYSRYNIIPDRVHLYRIVFFYTRKGVIKKIFVSLQKI